MKKIVSALVVCGMVGCGAWEKNSAHHYNIYVGNGFTDSQAAMIYDATTEWQVKSGNYITFSGISDDTNTPDVIAFSADSQQTIHQDFGASCFGNTQSEGQSSHIDVDDTLNDALFHETVLHEIGHAMGLVHNPDIGANVSGIMCANNSCASPYVMCLDLKQLCSVWHEFDCVAETMPGCK